jgi:ABC-type uncharacterized transport system substrate-binding protein
MSSSMARIGILSPVTEEGMKDWWKKLKEGLEELGYVEGRNIEFVWRFGDGKFERLPDLASELAKLGVDVIMPATPPAIYAAKSASSSIPIVFPLGSDPVETGSSPTWSAPVGTSPGWQLCRGCKAGRDWPSCVNAYRTRNGSP